MKKQFLLICFLSFAIIINAQVEIEDEIARNKNWDIGSSKTVNNCEITRLLGKNGIYQVTNVTFKPLDQIIKTYRKRADYEMWTSEELETNIQKIKKEAAGGWIKIYIERNYYYWDESEEFTLIVRDSLDTTELFRKDFSKRFRQKLPPPSGGAGGNWSGLKKVEIPEKLKEKRINIYVIDKIGNEIEHVDGKFKFQVTIH